MNNYHKQPSRSPAFFAAGLLAIASTAPLFAQRPIAEAPTVETLTPVATNVVRLGQPSGVTGPLNARYINNLGQVVLENNLDVFLWTVDGGFENIGRSGFWTYPGDFNDQGVIIGSNYDGNSNVRLSWSAATGWQPNGLPAGNQPGKMNNLGDIVVGNLMLTADGLQTLSSNWDLVTINDSRMVAGYDYSTQSAFVWNANNGNVTTIGANLSVTDINSKGQVVGRFSENQNIKMFFWDPKTGLRVVPALGGFQQRNWYGEIENYEMVNPSSINDAGQVVGQTTSSDGSYLSFVWDETNGMRVLLDKEQFPNSLPMSINNRGEIVGVSHGGSFYAKIAVPTCAELIAKVQAEVDALTIQLTTANGSIATLTTELAQANASLVSLQGQLAEKDQTNALLTQQLTTAAAEAAANILSLEGQIAGITAQRNALQAEVGTLTAQVATQSQTITSLTAQLAAKDAELAACAAAGGNLALITTALASLQSQISTSLGTSVTIPGATPAEQVQALSTAIDGLNPGQKKALADKLSGKK